MKRVSIPLPGYSPRWWSGRKSLQALPPRGPGLTALFSIPIPHIISDNFHLLVDSSKYPGLLFLTSSSPKIFPFVRWQHTHDYKILSAPKTALFKNIYARGAWVAQSVEHPTSAQVMISQLMGSSPASGYVLTAQGLEPASDSVFPPLSAPSLLALCLSLSLFLSLSQK